VTAVGALWLDGTFWFQTGAGTRKGRNVARDPRCSIAVSIRDADVVIEGDAARVTEPGALARVAKAWADNGWPAEPDDSGPGITAPFNAPSLGPPPWNVYRVEPRSAIVTLATEPGGLTRFRFLEWANREGSPFTFVTEGVPKAIDVARQIAGDKDVVVGAPSVTWQCLQLGLLDAIHIDLAPVVLGRGIRLFDHLTSPVELLITEASGSPHVTHITYQVIE
jgi:hypothetical protein